VTRPAPSGRPGRLARREARAALAAPAVVDGFTSGWHRVAGLRLHVRERVPSAPTAPACVLVHGLAVSHRYLMPTARCLRQQAVYVPDLPGFGMSDKPPLVYDVDDHATVLATWLDTLGGGPVCVLGNSFGCQVAVELARRRPDRVSALVLVGPTVDPAAASVIGQLGRWLRDLFHEDPRQAPILLADVRDAGPRRIAATLRLSVRDRIETKLPLLAQPTLLVRGQYDRVAPQRWLEAANRLTPGSRITVLAGPAHNAVTTAGPQLAAAVQAFLADIGHTTTQ
jgi:pimeloyl-ACP methyl ester carboxylesterase